MPHPDSKPRESALTKQAADLCIALKASQASPDPEPLHHLRSTLRRTEALLQLLPVTPNACTRFLKASKPIRRASGQLRDLDIQSDLLNQLPATPSRHPNTQADSHDLARHLQKKRLQQATELQHLLHKHHKKLLSSLEDLEPSTSNKPVQPAKLARTLFTHTTAALDPHDPEQLHAIRKAARISRYIAEFSPKSANSPTALHFHHLHQILGYWHDWLTLTETARQHLPANSPLIPTLERRRDQTHRAALNLLAKHLSSPTST